MSTHAHATHEVPALVGGVPLPVDFAPSVLFACLYAALLPVVLWRIINPRSRSTVLIGTTIFSFERIVSFALRARAAHNPGSRMSKPLETYFQVTYSSAFITIGQDLLNATRSLLVAFTLGGDMLAKHQLTPQIQKGESSVEMQDPLTFSSDGDLDMRGGAPVLFDHPRTRYWIRKVCGISLLLFLVTIIPNAIANGVYKTNIKSGKDTTLIRWLWFASAVLVVVLLHVVGGLAAWAHFYMHRVPRRSIILIIVVAILLSSVGIYRIDTVHHITASLTSTAPGSLNSNFSKAGFYIFHVAPEFLAVTILMSLNARRVFAAGTWGDLRIRDPKPSNDPTVNADNQ